MTDSTQHPDTTPSEPDPTADTRPLDARFPQDTTKPLPPVTSPLPDAAPAAEQVPSAPPVPPAAPRPPVRMSTVVWGLIIVVVGAGVVARALGADFDNQLALIVLLAAAGVALVATSIISAVRRR